MANPFHTEAFGKESQVDSMSAINKLLVVVVDSMGRATGQVRVMDGIKNGGSGIAIRHMDKSKHDTFIGNDNELIFSINSNGKKELYVHDGVTDGGIKIVNEIDTDQLSQASVTIEKLSEDAVNEIISQVVLLADQHALDKYLPRPVGTPVENEILTYQNGEITSVHRSSITNEVSAMSYDDANSYTTSVPVEISALKNQYNEYTELGVFLDDRDSYLTTSSPMQVIQNMISHRTNTNVTTAWTKIAGTDTTITLKTSTPVLKAYFSIFYETHHDMTFSVWIDGKFVASKENSSYGLVSPTYETNYDSTPQQFSFSIYLNTNKLAGEIVTIALAARNTSSSYNFNLNHCVTDNSVTHERGFSIITVEEMLPNNVLFKNNNNFDNVSPNN